MSKVKNKKSLNNKEEINLIKGLVSELAASKLSHLSDILEYRYGIYNTPCYNLEENSFNIFIDESYWECNPVIDVEPFTFDIEELLQMNVNISSHDLAKEAWSMIPTTDF